MTESTSPEQSGDEGFRASFAVPGGEDVEGHVQPGPSDEPESLRSLAVPGSDGQEGIRVRRIDDEDDVEGHQKQVI